MERILLITPPFVQPNCPYPATAYLKSYLCSKGYDARHADLSAMLLGEVFSPEFLTEIFAEYNGGGVENIERIHALRESYISTVGSVMTFLRGEDQSLAQLICTADFLPQASRFDVAQELDYYFGLLGVVDCAKFLCTLYLQDLSDFIRAVVSPHFEIVRYGESIAMAVESFSQIENELSAPPNIIERRMNGLIDELMAEYKPEIVGFSIPFPGNFLSTMRAATHIKAGYPGVKLVVGGGYPSTELRQMSDKGIFKYVDYVILDDGELPLERILSGGPLVRTYTADGYQDVGGQVSHLERGCPDFSGLDHSLYFSLTEVTNPMHRLWSDGRWNKIMLEHGCYWAKCAFCDTSLDYICRYDGVTAATMVDWMERVIAQTGSRGFHFVDEAASPRALRELSLEILRRGLKVSWWTNIRFESNFTGDLAALMSAAGCIAVSGGLEVASDRLLALMNKGVTVESATIAMRNFFQAGIMVHTYLMYGFPTQTLQESVDSLEVVRQLFRASLIDSAFWHRYAMTVHSPSGTDPSEYGARRKDMAPNPFANNEVPYAEQRQYNINMVGEALRSSLAAYMLGSGLDKQAHSWFAAKAPRTTVEPSLVSDCFLKPDAARIYNESARLVWVGGAVKRSEEGLKIYGMSKNKSLKFAAPEADFLVEVIGLCSDLSRKITFSEAREIYARYSQEPFVVFYHSKKWDLLRGLGLLQL